jgi:hypothetical protein
MALIMTQHARRRIAERGIDVAWIERTVALPMRMGPCPNHPDRTRAWRRIPERGNRVLRVVFVRAGADHRVITATFDRGTKV